MSQVICCPAKILGFSGSDGHSRVSGLSDGEFFAYGSAVSREVAKVKVGGIFTTHPRPGKVLPPVPARASIKKVLGRLADIPIEAERRAKTMEELQVEVARLNKDLRSAQKVTPAVSPDTLKREFERGVAATKKAAAKALAKYDASVKAHLASVAGSVRGAERAIAAAVGSVDNFERPDMGDIDAIAFSEPPAQAVRPVTRQATAPPPRAALRESSAEHNGNGGSGKLSGPEQRIVDAIAWLEDVGIEAPEQAAVAFLAGYTTGGGAYNNPRGALRSAGLIEYVTGDRLRLTESGRSAAVHSELALTPEDLQGKVLARLPGPEQKILGVLLGAYPESVSNGDCAAAAGYANGGGAYNNPRGRLRTLGLIDYPSPGMLVAKPLLFLERN